uniref:Uncharacterized protein n=1 Tax=Romanomermis culicivorax TaxID=13658 RepID=A0A915IR68_ROMCU
MILEKNVHLGKCNQLSTTAILKTGTSCRHQSETCAWSTCPSTLPNTIRFTVASPEAEKKDLVALCDAHLIPDEYQSWFRNLKDPGYSLWPLQGVLLELPPKVRCSIHNSIVFGFWYGKKPVWNEYLKQTILEIEQVKKMPIVSKLGNQADLDLIDVFHSVYEGAAAYLLKHAASLAPELMAASLAPKLMKQKIH